MRPVIKTVPRLLTKLGRTRVVTTMTKTLQEREVAAIDGWEKPPPLTMAIFSFVVRDGGENVTGGSNGGVDRIVLR